MKTKPKKADHFKTKRAILDHLKLNGPSDALSIAGLLKTTGMGVRQHLYKLKDQGVVNFKLESRAMGRPVNLWELTEKSDMYFPDSHGDLSLQLLDTVKDTFGEKGMEQFLENRKKRQIKDYRVKIPKDLKVAEKIKRLAKIRSSEGYMATFNKVSKDAYQLIENHCPICTAAKACRGLCEVEINIFKEVLGPKCDIVREEHIVAGERRCVYSIKNVG